MSVNIFTEWGPLKEVIVGNCFHHNQKNIDLSFKLFFNDIIKDDLVGNSIILQKKIVERRQEDLDNLSVTLENLGIKVLRPTALESVEEFKTPDFSDHLTAADNVRDQVLIIGDEMIETSCQWRQRYFENDLFKDIFLDYFKKGARWTCSPRPKMLDSSFDIEKMNEGKKLDPNKFEIMFDGAQCLKFGKDIVMNISTKNHELGVRWLEQHLGDKFRLHTVRITDHHIDGMFMPLRPGLLLINPLSMSDKMSELPKELQKWDVVQVPKELKSSSKKGDVFLTTGNINVNIFSLAPDKVLIFDEEGSMDNPLIKALGKYHIEAIPVRFRHSRLFGGGLHCSTLDTVREEVCEDYFS